MNFEYDEKDIGNLCPKTSCKGKLKKIKHINKHLSRFECQKCKVKLILDKKGCGTYE